MKELESPWVCTSCGQVAEGEMCRGCGAPQPVQDPGYARRGSVGQLYGFPVTRLAGLMLALFLVLPAFALWVLNAIRSWSR